MILNLMIIRYQEFNAGNYFIVGLMNVYFSIQFLDGNWILKDGDGQKLSTNGTWLFVDELFKIYDNMIFKAG